MAKSASLDDFRVGRTPKAPTVSESIASRPRKKRQDSPAEYPFIVKGFRVTPAAAQQFDILRAELQVSGIELIADALNMLFKKHNKPTIA
jgi:hypothetical protein